jgi:predicted transcriptional regulator
MTSPAVTTTPDAPVADAARVAARARVKRLPVVDGDRHLVGIVSRGDLLSVFLSSDEEIGEQVTWLLDTRLAVGPDTLGIDVHDGVVTLTGAVADARKADRAVEEIAALDAVVDVEDRLTRVGGG